MIAAYIKKELLLNLRQPQQYLAVILFGGAILLLFNFTTNTNDINFSVTIYWIQYLFAGIISLSSVFLSDENSGMILYTKLSPHKLIVFWIAKNIFAFIFILSSQIIPFILTAIWFNQAIFEHFLKLYSIIILVTLSFTMSGYIISTIINPIKNSSLVLAIIEIPLTIPIFLSGQRIWISILEGEGYLIWLKLLLAINLLFLGIGLLLSMILD